MADASDSRDKFAEVFRPAVEGLGYLLLPVAWYFGLRDVEFLVVLLLTTGFGVFLSRFGVFSEVRRFNRYESPRQVLRLCWYGVFENLGYRQWKAIAAWRGVVRLSGP